HFSLRAEVDAALDAALERGRRLGDARMLYQLRWHGRQAVLRELALGLRQLGAGKMHRVGGTLVGQVDHVFAGAPDVLEGVLDGAVGAPVEAEDAERRVFGDHVEEGERRAVGDAVVAPGGDPRDWPRDHQADEELVALEGWELGE